MTEQALQALEYPAVRAALACHAATAAARARIAALMPITHLDLCRAALRETDDARAILAFAGQPPLSDPADAFDAAACAARGELLSCDQLTSCAAFACACRRMRDYLRKSELTRAELSLSGRAFLSLDDLEEEINASIRAGEVCDGASNQLRDARRRLDALQTEVREKLSRMLRAHPEYYADGYVAQRGGRDTLPVKAQYQRQVPGTLVDRSQTGATLFVEPESVGVLRGEIELARLAVENEIRRVLYALTALVEDEYGAFESNARLMERLDFAFAKGKMSLDMDARAAEISEENEIVIVRGRHPLIDRAKCVPLDFALQTPLRGVVVTGPNTGGKTVCLKTVGLLCLMTQSGLHIPAGEGTKIALRADVLCDVGDGQSISENLSTFSAHMTRVLEVLKTASRESLALLDELGSGTDPAEGMGLAVAVLEALIERGCLFVVTTHYPEVKAFADSAPCVTNARMRFNPATLEPLYTLETGKAGESCALLIAKRLGFPDNLLARAKRAVAGELASEGLRVATESGARTEKFAVIKTAPERAKKFGRGDSVRVYPSGEIGIVAGESDEMGNLVVQTRAGKQTVPHKRLKLLVKADMLYPDDYDFSIVFDTVENRKARHTMERKFDPNAVIRKG